MQPSEVIQENLPPSELLDREFAADPLALFEARRAELMAKATDAFGVKAVWSAIQAGREKGFDEGAVLRSLIAQAEFRARTETPARLTFRHLPAGRAPVAPRAPGAVRAARKRERQNRLAGRRK